MFNTKCIKVYINFRLIYTFSVIFFSAPFRLYSTKRILNISEIIYIITEIILRIASIVLAIYANISDNFKNPKIRYLRFTIEVLKISVFVSVYTFYYLKADSFKKFNARLAKLEHLNVRIKSRSKDLTIFLIMTNIVSCIHLMQYKASRANVVYVLILNHVRLMFICQYSVVVFVIYEKLSAVFNDFKNELKSENGFKNGQNIKVLLEVTRVRNELCEMSSMWNKINSTPLTIIIMQMLVALILFTYKLKTGQLLHYGIAILKLVFSYCLLCMPSELLQNQVGVFLFCFLDKCQIGYYLQICFLLKDPS